MSGAITGMSMSNMETQDSGDHAINGEQSDAKKTTGGPRCVKKHEESRCETKLTVGNLESRKSRPISYQ